MGQWPRAYADPLENDLDLKVNLNNKASGGRGSDWLLADLKKMTSCGHWSVRPKSRPCGREAKEHTVPTRAEG